MSEEQRKNLALGHSVGRFVGPVTALFGRSELLLAENFQAQRLFAEAKTPIVVQR